MKKTNIEITTKETINKTGNTILRALHEVLFFDFEKPIALFEIAGNFTEKQIRNELEKLGMAPKINAVCAVIVKDPHFNEYKLATLSSTSGINTDYKTPYFGYKNIKGCATLDHFYRKMDFDEYRKRADNHAFVIAQNKDFTTEKKNNKPDLSQRFKFVGCTKATDGRGNHWISKIETRITGASGQKFEKECGYYNERRAEVNDCIDKSGYFVYIKRDELKQKSKKLRADRQKAQIDSTNNAGKIAELRNNASETKKAISDKMMIANTSKEMILVSECLDKWRGLPEVFNLIERIEKMDREKGFTSPAHFERLYNETIEKINRIYGTLDQIETPETFENIA